MSMNFFIAFTCQLCPLLTHCQFGVAGRLHAKTLMWKLWQPPPLSLFAKIWPESMSQKDRGHMKIKSLSTTSCNSYPEREKFYQKVTKKSQWPTPFCLPLLWHVELNLSTPKSQRQRFSLGKVKAQANSGQTMRFSIGVCRVKSDFKSQSLAM